MGGLITLQCTGLRALVKPKQPRKAPKGAFLLSKTVYSVTRVKTNRVTKMNIPKTRKEAKETGATHYFTGEPCSRGHIALRKTKGACVECLKEDWAKDNAKRAEYFKTSETVKENKRRYYERNKEAVKARASNRPKEDQTKYKRKYKEANPELYRALTNARRERFKEATPPWTTKEMKRQIRQKYLEAQDLTKTTGVRYEVDHIIPLINDNVCGLHVPWNMQIIPKSDNLRKSNKLS